MPKDVDHDARREELLEAVWRVIARDGMEGATIRAHRQGDRLVDRACWRTTSPTRTTSWARRCASPTSGSPRGGTQKLEGLTGIAALHELVLDNLPLDDERELETKLLMNYWSRAIRGQRRGAPPRAPRTAAHRSPQRHWSARARRRGRSVTDESPEDVAERLLGLIDGFSLHALLNPQRLTRERQVALIGQEFDRLSTGQRSNAAAGRGRPTKSIKRRSDA